MLSGALGAIRSSAASWWTQFAQGGRNLWNNLGSAAQTVRHGVAGAAQSAWNSAAGYAQNAWNRTPGPVRNALRSAGRGMGNLGSKLWSGLKSAGSRIKGNKPPKQPQNQNQSNTNWAKLLVKFEVLEGLLNVMKANSTVANTFLGGMGKMFGAVMDILLIPFMPIFNMIIMAMGKLIYWLLTDGSGILKAFNSLANSIVGMFTPKGMDHVTKDPQSGLYVDDRNNSPAGIDQKYGRREGARPSLSNIWWDMNNGKQGNVLHDTGAWLKDTTASTLGGNNLVGVGGVLGGLAIGSKIPFIGAPIRAATKFGVRGLVAGAHALALDVPAVAAPVAVSAGLGVGAGVATNWAAGKAGIHGMGRNILTGAAGGAVGGAALGALVGAPFFGIGAVPGALIGGAIGGVAGGAGGAIHSLMQGHGDKQGSQPGGVDIKNSNNSTSYTYNISGVTDPKQTARLISADSDRHGRNLGLGI